MDAMVLKFRIMNFVIVCMVFLLCCLNISEANNCKDNPCPDHQSPCYCPNKSIMKFLCVNGKWRPFNCDILPTITQPTTRGTEPTCPLLPTVPFADIEYSSKLFNYYPLGTTAEYSCRGGSHDYNLRLKRLYTRECKGNGWSGKEPQKYICSCKPPQVVKPKPFFDPFPEYNADKPYYRFDTTATYCNVTGLAVKATCDRNTHKFEWTSREPWKCKPNEPRHSTEKNYKITTSKSPTHHNEARTVVIVSGSTGAILGALIVLVVIVSCQRRIHYHRVRRARIRHRQDQDAFTAFITYHRDVRLMLPSYDEAINQQEQGQPPSFEEALGHYEEPTLPPGHTPASENPPSISTDSPTSSASPGSETRSLPENDSDTATLVSPTSENSRFFRSLRTLFGGRAFRPDAIYCRFVPDEDGSESQTRREERGSRNNATEDDLTEVLAQAGLY